MKKRYLLIIFSIILLLLFAAYSLIIHPDMNSPEKRLTQYFNCSGAAAVNAEVYFRARLHSDKYDDMDALKALVVSFSRELGVTVENECSRNAVENDLIRQVDLNGTLKGKRFVTVSAQLTQPKVGESESHIMVTVNDDIETLSLDETRQNVLDVFKEFGIKAEVTSCITGYYEGKLEKPELIEISEKILEEAGARNVEGVNNSRLISVSAYTPSINNHIMSGSGKININLAIRYNSYEDRTYIWLATPLIGTEY